MSKHVLQLSLDIETDSEYEYDELMVAIDRISNDLYRDGFNVLGFDVSNMDDVYNTFTDDSFNITESRNRIIEKSYSPDGARYEIICYYGNDFRGYKMSDETDSYDELKELAWDYINNGCIEIIDNKTGKSVRYTDPDEIYYEGEIELGI